MRKGVGSGRALHLGGTKHRGPCPKSRDYPGDSRRRRGHAGRGAGPEARDGHQGRPGPARGRMDGSCRGERAGGSPARAGKAGTGIGPRPRAVPGPAALTRLRGVRAPSPPPPHTKAPARRARPDEEAAPPAAARLSIRRAARRAGPGRPRCPARSAPRRPGGGSAPRRSAAAPPHGGTRSEVGGAQSHRASGGSPRDQGHRPGAAATHLAAPGQPAAPARAVVGAFPTHTSSPVLAFVRH